MNRPAILILGLLACPALLANNVQVSNLSLGNDDPAQESVRVTFDITWENSWRLSTTRFDAAWIFVKYQDINTGQWHHARLHSDAGHSTPAGGTINTGLLTPGSPFNAATNWGVGVFLYPSANSSGTFSANGVELRWNYGQNGIAFSEITAVKVFAIEMVHVAEGPFYLGSGATEVGSFTDGAWTSGPTIPFQVTSEGAITIAQSPGALWGTSSSGSSTIGAAGTLPADFPKGFAGFYLMKYEIAQQDYVDFLNTLTRTQQNTRTGTDISGTAITNRYVMSNSSTLIFRNGIRCDATIPAAPAPVTFHCDLNGNGTGGEAADGQWIACNFLSWGDLSAYLDWSGLRPISELEFEKACRGTIAPVADEYPWGTAGIATSAYTLANDGATNEGIATNYSTTLGNAVYITTNGTPSGPKRVGIFAANGSNGDRVTAGASYYGIMELGGNLFERAVTIGNANGRAFTGTHGNGALAPGGDPDGTNWPTPTTANGAGFRGGSWDSSATVVRVSDRNDAANASSDRVDIVGGRGARRSP